MKLYQELALFYLVLGALSIILVMLVILRIILVLKRESTKRNYKTDKEEFELLIREDLEITGQTEESDKISILGKEIMSNDAQSDIAFDSVERISILEKTSKGDSFFSEEVKQKASLINSINEKEVEKTNDCEVSGQNGFDGTTSKISVVSERKVELKELQKKYYGLSRELENRKSYFDTHEELSVKAQKIGDALLLIEEVIDTEGDDEIEVAMRIVKKPLSELENAVKMILVLIKLSQEVIPNMIKEKLDEYEKCRNSGIKVNKEMIAVLRGVTSDLMGVSSRIKQMKGLDNLLSELVEIGKKVNAVSVRELKQ